MNLKKNKNSLSHSAMPFAFRTLIKDRVNKQTLKNVVHLSAAIQQHLENDDKISVKSTSLINKKTEKLNFGTDKIKNFVRNMKVSKYIDGPAIPSQVLKTSSKSDLSGSRKSLYSVKSCKSKAQNFNSFHMERDISDNISVISTRSLAESQIMSKSKIFGAKQKDISQKERLFDKLILLEQRIDSLNKTKLRNLILKGRPSNRYPTIPLNASGIYTPKIESIQEDSLLEKQFQNIISSIQKLKQKQSDDRLTLSELQENISQLDKKIELFEKVIAQNSTEAEILRKYYFALKSQRCPHLNRREKIIQEISKRKQMLKTNSSMIEMRELNKKQPVIRYESTSKYFYTRPNQAAYLTQTNRNQKFVPNRQPFPRSCYDREFLNYGTLPVFNYKPHDSKHLAPHLHTKTSSYQQTFKQRHMQLKQINYKQLDCFKDKFKMGTISFSEMSKINHAPKNGHKRDIQKRSKENKSTTLKAMQTLDNLQSTNQRNSQMKFMGSTEMMREFVWHSKEKVEPLQSIKQEMKGYGRSSVIKNQKLNKLKNSYKMEFLR